MTNHPVFRAAYSAVAAALICLPVFGFCCPVPEIVEKPCPQPDAKVTKKTAEPIALGWLPGDNVSSAFNSRDDVLELAFDSFQFKAPPAAPAGTPQAGGTIIVNAPARSHPEGLFVQIRGNLQRPKTGKVHLDVAMGTSGVSFDIVAGQVQTMGGSVSYWTASPFNPAGDPSAVNFALGFETTMPGFGRLRQMPIKLNLSTSNNAGETAGIAVTSMTVWVLPRK